MAPKKTKNPLEVKPVSGEAFRYYVTSERNPETQYLVDMEHYQGIGWCSCIDFEMRRQPKLEKLNPNIVSFKDTILRCKHIKAAASFLGFEMLQFVIKNKGNEEKKIQVEKGS